MYAYNMNKTIYLRIMLLIMSGVQNIFYKINDNNNGSYSNEVRNRRMKKNKNTRCFMYILWESKRPNEVEHMFLYNQNISVGFF